MEHLVDKDRDCPPAPPLSCLSSAVAYPGVDLVQTLGHLGASGAVACGEG